MVQSKFLFDVVYSVKYGILWSSIALHSSIHCAFCNIWHCIAWFGGRDLVRVRIRAPGHITGDPSNASGAVVRFPSNQLASGSKRRDQLPRNAPKTPWPKNIKGCSSKGSPNMLLTDQVKQRSACLCDITIIFIFQYSSGYVCYSLPSDHISIFIHRVQKPCMICTGARNVRWNPKPAMWNDLLSFNGAASAFCNCVKGGLFVHHGLTSSTSI